MNIGLFQLENLLVSQVRFCFLDLSTEQRPLAPPLEALLARAHRITAEAVPSYLEKTLPTREAPVILLSENGHSADRLRTALEILGYSNIYVVEGGVEGLLSEL